MLTKSDFMGGLSMYHAKLMLVIDAGGSTVDEETLIRENEDLKLQTAINDEVNARKAADADLQAKITAIEPVDVSDFVTNADLNEEITARQADVAELKDKIAAIEPVDVSDFVTSTDLNAEITARQADVAELNGKIAAIEPVDTSDFVTNADLKSAVQLNVSKAVSGLESADRDLKTALDEEILLRENSLLDLQEQIDALGGESSSSVSAGVGVLSTVPATVDGGFWYELTDNVPMLWLRQNGYGYGFNFDTVRFVGTMDDALAAYLKFDGSTTADICGNTWTATGDVSLSTEIKKFGMSSVHLPNKAYLSADNIFNVNAEKWTFDAWCYLVSGDGNTGIVALGVKTAYEERSAGVQLLCSGIYVSNESSPTSWQKQYNPMPNISNQWVHIAVVKDGTSLTFYQNGTQFWTYTLTANLYAGDKFYLGYSPSWGDSLDIYFDNVRFFEGVALWNSDFAPPAESDYA